MFSRRVFFTAAAMTSAAGRVSSKIVSPASNDSAGLKPITGDAKAISVDERQERIATLQRLLSRENIGALLIEPGSTLEYFTGIRWHRSERITAAIIPARGITIIVCPAFEEPSVRESMSGAVDVRAWSEHESPFQRLVQGLRDRNIVSGKIAVEQTTRFFIVDGLRKASGSYEIISAETLLRESRLRKSPAELALLQFANDVTLQALRFAHGRVRLGMSGTDIAALVDTATITLGGVPEFALVLLNEASAYPHGSRQPQRIRDGSVVLLDCGCTVHGYQSDISRTWVFGSVSARQRKVWNTVKRGQEIALETAKLGVPVGTLDDAVRAYYEREGWGPGYTLPGLPHRTGHGIGLDGHEAPYLVHGDATPLQPGMCFSDEPGIYIPGEFGIRLEDCWYMTSHGPRTFTPLAKSLEEPI